MKKRIVLLGLPASGKGTQAAMMESRLRLPSVSPGAMLRAELSAGTSLGREADAYTRHGGLVPDAMVIALLKQWMESHDAAFVLDGFPRTVPQAEALEQLLAERGTPLDVVFYFDLPESTVRERVRHRLTCSGCGQIFNTVLAPVCKDGECPECGGRLIRRADDSPEALEHRLVEYHHKTEPLVSFYQSRGVLVPIQAAERPDAVFSQITSALGAALEAA